MSVIGDAFKKLQSNLEITQTEETAAITRHTNIRDYLRTKWDLDDDFLTGSYRRSTKTKPLKDVDIFVEISPTGAQGYLRNEVPITVLNELLKVLQVKWSKAFIDGMAVVIPFGPEDAVTSMEVVPAYARKGGGWFIPDPDRGRWLATNPKTHHQISTAKNKACDEKFVPFVKMVKAANRELGDKVEPSFLLEVMAHD
ncbi:nucleotidyltransferase domain-containing protein, partial [Nocardioides sp. GCM10030258]|uniref:SMODS domain-containing nucleotidyltransferase n=1 Tax=unclassified Nocardioides TaxID=2615069 RepID=UPI0036155B98